MSSGLDVFLDVIQILFLWNSYSVNFHQQLAEFSGCVLNCQPLLIYFVLKFRSFNFSFKEVSWKAIHFRVKWPCIFPSLIFQGTKAVYDPQQLEGKDCIVGILGLWNCLVPPSLIRCNCNVGNMPSHWISGAWVLEMLLCGGLPSAVVKGR